MDGSWVELLTRWDIPPIVTSLLLLSWGIYFRGWLLLRRSRPEAVPPWRCVSFSAGMLAIFAAVASPLDTFSETLLFMHMAQHFVLMSVAPPLIVLGSPVVPMLRGLPRWIIRRVLAPLFRTQVLHKAGQFLTSPRVAWITMNAAYVGWHIPRAYEFALSSENWHNFEHLCFLATSILFWWPIIEPWPTKRMSSRWVLLPYLLLADVINTAVSAALCFTGRLLYPSYDEAVRPFGIPALSDQVAAGAFMWVFGSIVFLVPAAIITMRLLNGKSVQDRPGPVYRQPNY